MADNYGRKHTQIKERLEAAIRKAEGGDIRTMFMLAYMYSNGEYVPKDTLAAEGWLRKAAELGSDEAKKKLAKLLSNGNGVAQDLEEAFDIYHELMLDCDVDAMEEVGFAYKLGRGVPKDEKKGSFFIQQAFEIELDLMRSEKNNSES